MPNAYIIAGPNGAGKTTFAREFLPDYADCRTFVNADLIAQGLSPFSAEAMAIRAGRIMLTEIAHHIRQRVDFGFETTFSGRAHLKLMQELKNRDYTIHLFFLWLASEETALLRISERVLKGGHAVSETDVRRRFARSISNFFGLYRDCANSWVLFDNSGRVPRVIASQTSPARPMEVIDVTIYRRLAKKYEKAANR